VRLAVRAIRIMPYPSGERTPCQVEVWGAVEPTAPGRLGSLRCGGERGQNAQLQTILNGIRRGFASVREKLTGVSSTTQLAATASSETV